MLFNRTLVDAIGLLDGNFGSGNFEDDDYCLRAALLGFRNAIAGDVFIHHYGSRSFIGNRIDYSAALSGNRKIFNDKWSGVDAGSPLGRKLLIVNAIYAASELNHRGQSDPAIKTLLTGISRVPEAREPYTLLAEMLIDAKNYKDALAAVAEMPAGGDADIRKLSLIGYCLEGLGQDDRADDYADLVLALSPVSAAALNLKGILAYKRSGRVTAEDFFRQAAESDPGYGEPSTNIGILKWAAGEREEAVRFLEKGFLLSPTAFDAGSAYHSAITAAGEFARAEGVFREARALFPLNRRIAFLLIDVLINQHKNEPAMGEIEQAMMLFGIDDGILAAALEIRGKIGPQEIDKSSGNGNSLSLCMIVKNEEQHLAKCLTSVQALVDEMIVVDTGSIDRTREIATAFGAKVYDFPWTGDFSEARNFSLSKASGDWVLVLDADEVLSPLDHPALKQLIARQVPEPAAYAFLTRNYVGPVHVTGWTANDGGYSNEEAGSGWMGSIKVRLFPRDSRIQFENPVHELVEPSLRKSGIPAKDCSIPVHHYGKLNRDKGILKGKEYYLLGRKKLEETGDDPDAIRELAVQAGELKLFDEAIDLWQRALGLRPDMELAYINLVSLHLQMDRFAEALDASKKAVALKPGMIEAVCNYALCEMYAGEVDRAITALEKILKKDPAYPSANIMLAIAYFCAGKKEKGNALFKTLRFSGSGFAEALHPFARKLLTAGRTAYALTLLDAAIENDAATKDIIELREACGERSGAAVEPEVLQRACGQG